MIKAFTSVPQILVGALLLAFAVLSTVPPAQAADAAPLLSGKPQGQVVLSVSGDIHYTNADGKADFDMATLMSMPSTRIETTTPWTHGKVTFEGISVKSLLNLVGAKGHTGEFRALNDYTVRIELSDPVENGAIIAYLQDGKRMSVRDKGPLWLIYPMDSDPKLQTPVYQDRMIWQLRSIQVK